MFGLGPGRRVAVPGIGEKLVELIPEFFRLRLVAGPQTSPNPDSRLPCRLVQSRGMPEYNRIPRPPLGLAQAPGIGARRHHGLRCSSVVPGTLLQPESPGQQISAQQRNNAIESRSRATFRSGPDSRACGSRTELACWMSVAWSAIRDRSAAVPALPEAILKPTEWTVDAARGSPSPAPRSAHAPNSSVLNADLGTGPGRARQELARRERIRRSLSPRTSCPGIAKARK